jgi:ribosomal protein S18 acetylase RimI-like enzyme
MTASVPFQIRRLTHADLPAFRTIRLEALLNHPEAFGSSFEEEAPLDLTGFARLVSEQPPGAMFGGFAGRELAGIAGLFVPPRLKQRHKGTVVSVYVRPAHRGTGLAREIMRAVIAAGRDAGLTLLQLTVTVGNESARRLYLGLGFRTYGLEKRALRVDGAWFDDELMTLGLDGGAVL